MDIIETKLMNRQPGDLRDEIEDLKRKTEQNRQTARDAREAADFALNNATDTDTVCLLTRDIARHKALVGHSPPPTKKKSNQKYAQQIHIISFYGPAISLHWLACSYILGLPRSLQKYCQV